MVIDLRSDTVTRPTDGMRRAMAAAPVGDDVFGEDPTVNELEERTAELLGKEAGLFVASGTMGNLVSILAHAGRGDELIAGHLAHTFLYEAGGSAALGGIHPHTLPNAEDGTLAVPAIEEAIRNPQDPHHPPTRLICIENTHNRCGGIAVSIEYGRAVSDLARQHGLSVHLDGARLFNAAVALSVAADALAACADSVSICLSKGLGAPVGAVVCGSRSFIARARRMRKIVGGGMRQAGILAAAGIHAFEHHIDRLADDHRRAQQLACGIERIAGLSSPQAHPVPTAWTNLVYVHVDPERAGNTATALAQKLAERDVLCLPLARDQIRMVTHLDVSDEDIGTALDALRSIANET